MWNNHCHLSLSWASPIQSIYPHPTSWRSILILSTHLRLGLPSDLLPSGFNTKILHTPSPHPCAPHVQSILTYQQLSLFKTHPTFTHVTEQLLLLVALTLLMQLNVRNLLPNYSIFLLKLPVRVQHTCAIHVCCTQTTTASVLNLKYIVVYVVMWLDFHQIFYRQILRIKGRVAFR